MAVSNLELELPGNSERSRRFSSPIPLGSLTAQVASKSFWTRDMFNESLKQIAHIVAKESSLQNSTEFLEENKCSTSTESYDTDIQVSDEGNRVSTLQENNKAEIFCRLTQMNIRN